jgi:hypothetical protein
MGRATLGNWAGRFLPKLKFSRKAQEEFIGDPSGQGKPVHYALLRKCQRRPRAVESGCQHDYAVNLIGGKYDGT